MTLASILERFMEKTPLSVMARAIMERIFKPQQLNEWFDKTAQKQYTKELLFSTVFDIISLVIFGSYKTLGAAIQARKDEIPVSVQAVYDKVNGIETHVSEELVRFAAEEVTEIVEQMGGKQPPLLEGFRIKILDGNCIEATEHRIKELRSISSGALPGKSLVVYDPSLRIPIDVFLCEDGHAQERSMLIRVLESVQKDDCWIADRNFCVVNFLCGIDNAGGYFIIRRHGKLPWKSLGSETAVGITETGEIFEQPIAVTDESGQEHKFRQIRIVLKKATRDGDKELFLITNLPMEKASGAIIAGLYRHRWRIETAFQELKKYLVSEINTMGYPPAALFAFSIALVAYMVVSVLKASLCSVHGVEKIENEVSNYYIADEIAGTCRGMMIAIDDSQWEIFSQMTRKEFVAILIMLAKKVNLAKYKKHPRGPKKPPAKRRSDPKIPHVSTARILKKRKKK